jgi:O-antigen ligase/tetratricopeptide (TPR) repeat protein
VTTAGASRRGLRFLLWIGLVLAAFFVLFIGGTYAGLADQPVRIFTQVVTLTVLGAWLLGLAVRPEWRPRGDVTAAVVVAVAGAAVATALSQRPRLSLEAFLVGAAVAAAFLLLLRLAEDRWFRPRLGTLIVAIPFVVAVGNLLQVGFLWAEWWGYVGHFVVPPLRPAEASLTLGGPNVVPGYLLLLAPLGAAIVSPRRGGTLLAIVLLTLSVAAIVISGSRGGLLGVGVAVIVAAVWLLLHGASVRGRIHGLSGRAGIAIVLIVGLGVAVLAAPALLGRFLQTAGIEQRLDFWRAAWAIFLEHPITGSGPGTWALLKFAENPVGAPNLVVPHAHNLVLQTLAETGLVGLLSTTPLVVLVGSRIVRGAARGQGTASLEAIAVAAGLGGFFAQSLVDNLLNLPAVGLMLATVIAWAIAADGRRQQPSPTPATLVPRVVWAGLAGVVLVAAGWFAWQTSSAALTADRGRGAVARGDWMTARVQFAAALAADDLTLYRAELAVADAWTSGPDSELEMFRRVVEEDPYPVHLLSLGRLELAAGDASRALEHARLAWQRGSADASIALNVGTIAEEAGDPSLAEAAYLQALRLEPRLVGADYWRDPARDIPIDAMVDRLMAEFDAAGDPLSAATVRAFAGDPASALNVLEGLPSSISRDLALADTLDLLGRRQDAVTLLQSTLEDDPLAAPAADWLAMAAEAAGDEAAATRYRRWAVISGTGAFARIGGFAGEVTDDPFAASPMPHNYSWAVYLRHKPIVFVVPGILGISQRTLP